MSAAIRRAEPRDLATLGVLGAHLMRTHYQFNPRRFLPPGDDPEGGYAWFLGTQLEEPDVAIFVADDDADVVGYVSVGLEPLSWKELRGAAGFIHDIVVLEPRQSQGIARQLLTAALDWLRQRGAPRAMLWTAVQNDPAHRLFERAGFTRTMIEMTLELDASQAADDAEEIRR